MAIVLVAHAAVSPGGTTGAVNTTGANLIVIAATDSNGAPPTVTDNQSNTYTSITTKADGSTQQINLWYCLNPTVNASHTFTVSGSFPSLTAAAFSGVKASGALDQHNNTGNTAASTTVQPGSITPTSDNSLVITAAGIAGAAGATLSVNNSLSITDQKPFTAGTNYGTGLAWIVQGAAAAINPTWTLSATPITLVSVIASFLPVPTASTVLPGAAATGTPGSLAPSNSSTIALSGAAATSHVGQFSASAATMLTLLGAYATGFVGSLFSIANYLNIPITTIMNMNPIPMTGALTSASVPMVAALPGQVPLDAIITLNPIPMSGAMINPPIPGQVVFP